MAPLPRSIGAVVVVLAAAVACGTTTSAPSGPLRCEGVEVLAVGSDYSSSVVCGAPPCVLGPSTTGADLGDDPQLTASNGRVFYLSRTLDYVFEVDAKCGTPKGRFDVKSVAKDASFAGAANPHDAAAAPDGSVWVALYNVPRIAIVKDARVVETIDLSAFDADQNPQAESIRIVAVGGVPKAFVALERLDDRDLLRSKQPSFMLRIDVATRQVEATIPLEGRNPFNPMKEEGGALFLAEPGNFDVADEPLAGIERFDTTTSTTRLLVPEKVLGGSVAEVAVTDGCGAAIVAGPERDVNPTSLVTFDPTTGAVLSKTPLLGPTPGYDLQGLAWRGSTLYVGDRRAGGSGYPVHVFERAGTCELADTKRALAVPLPPVALRAPVSP